MFYITWVAPMIAVSKPLWGSPNQSMKCKIEKPKQTTTYD